MTTATETKPAPVGLIASADKCKHSYKVCVTFEIDASDATRALELARVATLGVRRQWLERGGECVARFAHASIDRKATEL